MALDTAVCSVDLTSVGVINISSNDDLTSITVTITAFNETLSVNYSCFKTNNDATNSVCLNAGMTYQYIYRHTYATRNCLTASMMFAIIFTLIETECLHYIQTMKIKLHTKKNL